MKSRLYKLALFLLLGTIVNVAVTWACAAWQPWPHEWLLLIKERRMPSGEGFHDWTFKAWGTNTWKRALSTWTIGETASLQSNWQSLAEKLFPNWAKPAWPSTNAEENTTILYFVEIRGWPFLSMRSEWINKGHAGPPAFIMGRIQPVSGYHLSSDNSIPWDAENPRVIPLRPIWPEFAINTIFYAAFLWLLTLGPITARRVIRRKRGLCIKCGYDLRGTEHQACPECGKELAMKVIP